MIYSLWRIDCDTFAESLVCASYDARWITRVFLGVGATRGWYYVRMV